MQDHPRKKTAQQNSQQQDRQDLPKINPFYLPFCRSDRIQKSHLLDVSVHRDFHHIIDQ